MGGVVGEASRLISMEIFVKKKGVRPNINDVLCQSLQCFVPFCSLDFIGETKDGFKWTLELPTNHMDPQLSLYIRTQPVCFPRDFLYKCADDPCSWSHQGLSCSFAFSFAIFRFKVDNHQPNLLWYRYSSCRRCGIQQPQVGKRGIPSKTHSQ